MTDIVPAGNVQLTTLIERAAGALTSAKSSAEVLEARDMARVAYDAAKSAGRMARGKQAYDEVIGAVYRAQADALLIEARAKMRLADEYDAAQKRGEVAAHGGDKVSNVAKSNVAPTAADIGLRRDEVHEGRKLRNAEAEDPGKAQRALQGMVDRGEEPTKAKLRRELEGEKPAAKPVAPDPHAQLRAEFRKLTDDAKEDDWVGLRLDNAELREKLAKVEAERDRYKAANRDLSQSNQGATISRIHGQLQAVKRARDEAMSATKREEYKRKKAEQELSRLMGQEVEI